MLVSSSVVAFGALALAGVMWNDRAEDLCRDETASSSSVTWEWNEFAYVCDEAAPDEQRQRIGFIDAFHGGGNQRHRPDR